LAGTLSGLIGLGPSYGSVFCFDGNGAFCPEHRFDGPDGANPVAALIEARDGSFYGTTQAGGSSELGTAFKIDATGAFSTLHSFSGPDGSNPYAELIEATDGHFYGTALRGGPFGGGVVFRLTMPGPPGPRFLRGDCNSDGEVRGLVTDAVFLLNFNFLGGTRPSCFAACDANGDGQVSGVVTDAVYLLSFNFLGGPAPPEPFPGCGGGTEADTALGCETASESCGVQGQNP
jgi:uncharacterized repeat protein (TIGR03803 family)